MLETLTREEELRNDLDNLHFARKYYFGVLAELEQLGRFNSPQYKQAEKNIRTLNHNIQRLQKELENEEL